MNPDRTSKPPSPATTKETAAPAREQSTRKPPELAMHYCPNCSQRLEPRSCKLRCNRCGYFMDCSDYY